MCGQDSIHAIYPPLNAPPLDVDWVKRGTKVMTRYFFANSIPGNKATVVSVKRLKDRAIVRCNYGQNQSGQSLLKWMDADALTLDN